MTENKNIPSSISDVPFRRVESRKYSTITHGLVGVIDESTNTVSFSIYTTPDFNLVIMHSMELRLITPQDGWFEQDPEEIMQAIYTCCNKACDQLPEHGYAISDIATIGITNQRETTIVWDTETGQPLYNALVWNDIRSNIIVDRVLAKVSGANKNHFRNIVGLPVSPYFSALKIAWLKDNVPEVRKACRDKRCKVGTVDSWIIYNLTKGSLHITDVTNASRTLLMNIETLNWDPQMLKTFGIDKNILPEIRSCSEIYGIIRTDHSILKGVPISGIMGNQQASLLGQMCIKPGQAKNTYRSGCFLLYNTGNKHVISRHGLLTTVAYKLGPDAPVCYALEGAIAVGGHALDWLQNKVRLLGDTKKAEESAEMVRNTGGVYFVPAFTGLYAPYWRKDARGIIIGLTQFSNKHHIVRAALESICYQTRDILECMYQEGGHQLNKLYADGSLTSNNLLMQLQADIAGVPVLRAQLKDSTAFGAAMCAAQARGIDLCRFNPEKRYYENVSYDTFLPTTTDDERQIYYNRWKKAVERSLGWVVKKNPNNRSDANNQMLASVSPGLFFILSFAMYVFSSSRTSL